MISHDWKPVKPQKIKNSIGTRHSYRRFLNADGDMIGAVGFAADELDFGSISLALQISDCRRSITLEFEVDDESPESIERARYKLDCLQEAINHAHEVLGI